MQYVFEFIYIIFFIIPFREAYKHYPEQRHLTETNLTEVEIMLQLGIKVDYLQHHIQTQHGIFLTRKDLHNIHQKAKTDQTTVVLPYPYRIQEGKRVLDIDEIRERCHPAYQKKTSTHRKHQRTKSSKSKLNVRRKLKKNPPSKIQTRDEMMVMLEAISDFASTLSTSQFEETMDALATMYNTWLSGERVIFTTAKIHVDEPCYHCGKITKTSNFPSSPSNNNNNLPSSCTCESITDCGRDTTKTALPSPLPVKPQKIAKVKSVNVNKDKLVTSTSTSSAKRLTKLLPKTPKVRKNVIFDEEMKTVFKAKQKLQNKVNAVTVFKAKQKLQNKVNAVTVFKAKQELQKEVNAVTVFKAKQKLQKKRKLKEDNQNVNVNIVDESDKIELIGNPREMLTDMHINAAQDVLSRQFPDILGLQDTLLGIKLQSSGESVGGGYVQIIHDGPLHWLTASNLFCHDNCVDIFDSLSTSVSIQAASLMMSQKHTITINMINCHRQKGVYDCGLYAVAYATDLCFGNDPGKKVYTQSQIRDHLLCCLAENKLRPFPGQDRDVQRRVTKAFKVMLHCIC